MSETVVKYLSLCLPILGFILSLVVQAKTNESAFKLFWKVVAVILGGASVVAFGWLAWGWLTARIDWPRWALIPFWLSGPALGFVALWLKFGIAVQEYEDYRSDVIHGLRWDWSYPNIENTLAPLCPNTRCQGELEQAVYSRHNIALVCHGCGFNKPMDCEYSTLKDRTLREIRRLIRIGKYKERLQPPK